MKTTALETIEMHFGKVKDPRLEGKIDHKLIEIVTIAICAVICGAEGWSDIENFGKKKDRLAKNILGVSQWHSISRHIWAHIFLA